MTMYSFEYLNHKPEDFGTYLRTKTHNIGFPARKKVTAEVPFSNTKYDFSEIYGVQTYGERSLEYVINVLDPNMWNQVDMHALKTKLANWVESGRGKQPLTDEKLPGWHFLAEPESALALADNYQTGELTVSFVAYPFMIRDVPEGDDVWDTFNFEYDIAQYTSFKVTGSKSVLLINNGLNESYPEVTTDTDMVMSIGNNDYQIKAGVSNGITIPTGENTAIFTGTGNMSLMWHKEVI